MAQKVLLYTSAITDAVNEIGAAGGSVPLQLSDRVFVAVFSDNFNTKDLKFSSIEKPNDTDENSVILANAWEQAAKRISEKELSPTKEKPISWGDKDHHHPKNPKNDPVLRELLKQNGIVELTPAATSETMNKKVAVGILIVSGPTPDLQFTSEEFIQVVSEVLEGLFFLAGSCYEANLNFTTITYNIPISAPSTGTNAQCNEGNTDEEKAANAQKCQALFRDPALIYLNYPPSYNDGCVQLVNDLKINNKTDWAYIAFFTKYPLYHYAYQFGVNIFMQYANDNWGPDKINQAFAHETCHVFGAADEYEESNCNCDPSGKNKVPNCNCVHCKDAATSPDCIGTEKVECLMNKNTLSICNWSRGQLGWGYWKLPFRQVYGYKPSVGPCIGVFNSLLFLTYAKQEDNTIYMNNSIDYNHSYKLSNSKGESFSTKKGVGMAAFNNELFIAWKGKDDENIRIAYSPDGKENTWTNYKTGFTTGRGPSLAALGSRLFLVRKSNTKPYYIRISYSNEGHTKDDWTNYGTAFETSDAPAVAAFNGYLYLAWRGEDGIIYIAKSEDGGVTKDGWIKFQTTQKTSDGPTLTGFNNRLWLAYTNSTKIYYGSSPDGKNWGQKFAIIDKTETDTRLSITSFDNNLYMGILEKNSHEIMIDNFIPGVF